jgi:hypothetical protein
VYFQAIKLGPTYREAEFAKVGRRVNDSLGVRHLQCTMDVCIRMKEFTDGTQGQFYLAITGMRGSKRYSTNRGRKFVIDPMIQFMQQQEPHLWCKFDSNLRLSRHASLLVLALRPRDAQEKARRAEYCGNTRERAFSL